jgi:protein required for attachment to host cells
MQISENLPQFKDKKTLIIVASTQSADLYSAFAGEIEQIVEIRTEKLDDDGQKGHFERRSKGQTLGSGGVEKDEHAKLRDRFNNDLEAALKEIGADIEAVILLSSPQDKPTTKEQLPARFEKQLTVEIDGNYVGEHPNKILAHIQKAQD